MTTTLSQSDEQEITDLLVGRRIVSAEMGDWALNADRYWRQNASGRLELDDGTKVYVVPNEGGCACSAGDYFLTHLASVDNVITSVRLDETTEAREPWQEGPTTYRIYVVADAVEINAVTVEGDDGSGYYGTGYELHVVKPGHADPVESAR